jgi:DNA repair protein RecO (recombination protein O)
MAEIIKSDAIVLKKTKFSDTSLIVHFYSKEFGKISALLKGARSSKSKIGSKIDLINNVEIVIYKKEERELQLVTQANLINHFPKIKESLTKIKFASAICEMVDKLLPEHESNDKLYRGTIKILKLINDSETYEGLHFAQYLFFFIKEIGFEISFKECSICNKNFEGLMGNAFDFSSGIICKACNQENLSSYQLNEELFNLFKCLTSKNNIGSFKPTNIDNIIFILEKYLIYHNSDFKGIKSLQIF